MADILGEGLDKIGTLPTEPIIEPESPREISLLDWIAEAEGLFGKDARKWRYRCANCGHIQTPADFIELTAAGIWNPGPETAYFSCVGRFDTRIPDDQIGQIGDKKAPCNYTLGGLFCFAKTFVIKDVGVKIPVFEFAPLEPADEGKENYCE